MTVTENDMIRLRPKLSREQEPGGYWRGLVASILLGLLILAIFWVGTLVRVRYF